MRTQIISMGYRNRPNIDNFIRQKFIVRTISFVFLLLLCVVLFGCKDSTPPENVKSGSTDVRQEKNHATKQELTKINLRLKWLVQVHSAGEIVADKKDFFKRNGLECNILPGGPDFNSIKLVAAGTDDYGVTSADQLILARKKGIPIVAIGVLFHDTPVAFFARKEIGLLNPSDFIGKRVGVKFGSNAETEYMVLLKRAGIDRSQIKEIPVKFDLRPFLMGDVDIWPGYESNEPITVQEKGIEVDVLRSREHGITTYSNVYITSEKRLREHPEEVKKFMQAVAEGWKYVLGHQEESVHMVLTVNNQLSYEHELKALKLSLPLVFPNNNSADFGIMDNEGWTASQSVLLDGGLLSDNIEFSTAYTNILQSK